MNHFSVVSPLGTARNACSHAKHHASGRAVSVSSPQKNPTRTPLSIAWATCVQTRPIPCLPCSRQTTSSIRQTSRMGLPHACSARPVHLPPSSQEPRPNVFHVRLTRVDL